MNKKIIITLILLLLIILGIIIYKSNNKELYNIEPNNNQTLYMCKAKEKCQVPDKQQYTYISINTNSSILKKSIFNINNETNRLYKRNKNSNICNNIKDIYNYRYNDHNYYNIYEDKNIISISVQRTEYDLCKDKVKRTKPTIYIYSKTNNKLLSQEDFILYLKLSKSKIISTINNRLNEYNKEKNTNYKLPNNYKDYYLFYSSDKELYISFKIPEEDMYLIEEVK